jgi:hypothetical protein
MSEEFNPDTLNDNISLPSGGVFEGIISLNINTARLLTNKICFIHFLCRLEAVKEKEIPTSGPQIAKLMCVNKHNLFICNFLVT